MPVDDKLLELTKHYAGTLVTNDVYLKIKATIAGLQTHGYGGVEDYSGVKEWIVTLDETGYSTELEEVLTSRRPPMQFAMRENEYLIIRDNTGLILNILVWRGGELQDIKVREIRNKWIKKIYPRAGNAEQQCLFDALNNEDITIIYAGGGFGLGKTYILNNFALQELECGRIKKIIYVPNNAYVANSMELGYLPGSSFEKITPSIGPLIDLVGVDEVARMIQSEQLEIIPIGYMRGRNFEDSIVLVSEAQNLDEEQVKLLIGRIGNGSRILFDGSLKQVDSQLFKNKSGLKMLLHISEHETYSKKFATVKLKKVERSETAQIADYLDNLDGNL